MRYIACFIIFFLPGIHSNAQTFLKDTFSLHDADFDALVETNLSQIKSKQNLPVLAFIKNKEDAKSAEIEKDFDKVLPSEKENLHKVKVLISLNKDSMSRLYFERVSSKIISLIVLECSTHNIKINQKGVIISGANDGAVLALRIAAQLPESFNKTGIFISDYPRFYLMKDSLTENVSNIKGKVFIYTQKEAKVNFATEFADSLALNVGVMMYKVDNAGESDDKNMFTEFFNWSMADGNNYIIDME